MKEKIANLLVRLAYWLSPTTCRAVEQIAGYEAKKLGVAIAVSDAEIAHYRKAENCSYRKAKKIAIKDMKKRVRQSIYGSLIEGRVVEYEVSRNGDDIVVSGYIRVYQRKQ